MRGHHGFVVVLDFNVQDKFAIKPLHLGHQVGAAVFNALALGLDDLGAVHLHVQQHADHINCHAFEVVFGDDVFVAHE